MILANPCSPIEDVNDGFKKYLAFNGELQSSTEECTITTSTSAYGVELLAAVKLGGKRSQLEPVWKTNVPVISAWRVHYDKEPNYSAGNVGLSTTNEFHSIDSLLQFYRFQLLQNYREKLIARLKQLREESIEEEPSHSGIEIESLRDFLGFLQGAPNLQKPLLSLTPEREIYATWKDSPKKLLSIRFLGGKRARFVIFKPNNKDPGMIQRLSGSTTSDAILQEFVIPLKIADWVFVQ